MLSLGVLHDFKIDNWPFCAVYGMQYGVSRLHTCYYFQQKFPTSETSAHQFSHIFFLFFSISTKWTNAVNIWFLWFQQHFYLDAELLSCCLLAGANNLIPMEIALKIANKIRAHERFAVYIIVPMWPEGVPTGAATQRILFWQVGSNYGFGNRNLYFFYRERWQASDIDDKILFPFVKTENLYRKNQFVKKLLLTVIQGIASCDNMTYKIY